MGDTFRSSTLAALAFAGWTFRGPGVSAADTPVPAAGAAFGIRAIMAGPGTVTPVAGVNDLALMLPVNEPLTAGAPPVLPRLVSQIGTSLPARVLDSRAGYTHTSPRDLAARGRVRVEWTGLERVERDAVIAFLRDVCGHGRIGFDVAIDGGAATNVRELSFADTWVMKTGWSIVVEAEEVL